MNTGFDVLLSVLALKICSLRQCFRSLLVLRTILSAPGLPPVVSRTPFVVVFPYKCFQTLRYYS